MNGKLFKTIWQEFNKDKVFRLASSIAFSTIFSIAPLLIVLIAIVGWVLGIHNGGHGHHLAEKVLLDEVRKGAGKNTANTVAELVAASFNKPRQGLFAQVIGWIAFLCGAAALFSALQDSLNAIWHVESTRGGWKQLLRDRIASFGMILVVGFILLLTFIANASIAFIETHFLAALPIPGNPAILTGVDQIVTFFLLMAMFAVIYKILPAVSIKWRDVWLGAAVTALLFLIGEALIALYLALTGVASAYGAAGSLLVGLLWIYYSATVLLLGAEFTKVAASHAQTIVPSTIRTFSEHPAGIDPRFVGTAPAANQTPPRHPAPIEKIALK